MGQEGSTRRRYATCRRDLHEMTFENTYVRPDHDLECRACRAEASRRYRASLANDHRYLTKASRRMATRRADPSTAEEIRAQDRARYAADPEKFRARQRDRNAVSIPNFHRRDDLLDDWVQLRAGGCSVVTAAARLGMKPDSLYRALLRARRAGDPRAYITVADCGDTLTKRVT